MIFLKKEGNLWVQIEPTHKIEQWIHNPVKGYTFFIISQHI